MSKKKNRGTRPFMKNAEHDPQATSSVIGDALEVDESMTTGPGAVADASATGGEAAPGQEITAEPAEAVETEVEGCGCDGNDDLEKIRAERDTYLDLARRERADFDNYRKRVERDMRNIKRESLASFLKEFFGPLDDLDRVMQESAKNHSFESLVQGVRLMEENFWRALAKAGVTKIDAKGKPFDPNLHEAMAAVPLPDAEPNTVLEVYENGYKLDEFILRPAKVVVSSSPDA